LIIDFFRKFLFGPGLGKNNHLVEKKQRPVRWTKAHVELQPWVCPNS